MFEANLEKGSLFKMLIESMKELVSEGNLDCSKSGISLQVRYDEYEYESMNMRA